MKTINLIRVAVLFAAISSKAQSTLITFDEFDTSSGRVRIQTGYQGLNWTNFFAFHEVGANNGFVTGIVSPPNVAFNGGGVPADISSATPFTLESGYFNAAFNDGLQLEVQGYNGTTLLYDQTYMLTNVFTGPTYISFNFSGITDAHFISSGGIEDPSAGQGGFQFAMDNLTISTVPEPSTSAFAAFACLSWLFYGRRK